MAVADVQIGDFSALWGNNPDNDLATPSLVRDKEKEDMIFDRLDRWIWSLENDKPPTMAGIPTKLALDSLAKIYTSSKPGLPTIEFSCKQERHLRQILAIQGEIDDHNAEIARLRERMEAHSAKIIEVMKDHEHGVLETTADKILIDFVTKPSVRTDTKKLKKDYPTVYAAVTNTSESRRLKVSVQPL